MSNDNQKTLEQKIIGGILITPNGFTQVSTVLRSEMFAEVSHQKIFSEMANLYAAQKPVKRALLSHALGEEINGISTDALLSAMEQTALSEEKIFFEEFAWAIQDAWVRRAGAEFFKQISDTITKPNVRTDELLTKAMAKLELFSANSDIAKTTTLYDAFENHTKRISDNLKNDTEYGYHTGVQYIHDLIGNVIPGQYIIIGAGTKTGKTAMAIDVGLGLANYGPVLCFSPEMMPDSLAARQAASETGISTRKQRAKNLSSQDYEKLDGVKNKVSGSRNYHIISKKMTIEEIFKTARQFKAKHGQLCAVIVDHLGILKPMKGGGRRDYEVAAEASPVMKEIAEELDCVSIGLSQLNKETVYGRTIQEKINFCSRPPSYHDLKGAIANDADHVIMPYRREAILSNIEPAKNTEDFLIWEDEMTKCKGKGHVRLALSREAVWPKTIPLYWIGEKTRFESMEQPKDNFHEELF